ncbi:MAG: cell division protein FtsZ [Bacteroidia bacterium]
MKFDIPEHSSIIKVIGVGGGGSNAVNHMYRMGIRGVDFVVCNTDKQALDMSPIPHKITLGATLTEGRGAGSIPDVGRNAAIENIEDIRSILANNTKMVFITAGLGGGTGTGAAPVIAGIAREMGILTVGIVTVPFGFEGKKRRQQAEEGLEQLKQSVDTLLVICNDKLREMYGNLKLSDAFGHADDVLSTAAKSIAEIISLTQQINVDFADVCTVMRNSGVAIMGSATASGENRAVRAVEESLNSPLLNDNNITGARYVLLNIVSGAEEITMDELGEITDYIQEAAGMTAEIIKGYGVDETLGDSVSVTIIATGFNSSNPVSYEYSKTPQNEKVVRQLDEQKLVENTVLPVKNEYKSEVANELEPFLISRTEEAPRQSTIEFEVTNNANIVSEEVKSEEFISDETSNEPFLLKTEEVIESVSETPVAQEEVVAEEEEIKLITKELVTPVAEVTNEEQAKKVAAEEQVKKAQERISKLKEISLKLKTTQGLSELENEPAYKRRNIDLENTPHSSESQVSRFTLTETEDKKIEIRPNNSFLHDNVD